MSITYTRAVHLLAACAVAVVSGIAMAGGRDSELLPAIRASDYLSVKQLLATRAADPNRLLPDGSTPLSWAVESQDPRMVRMLLDAKAKPDAARNAAAAPLILACEHGNAEILAMLLTARADARRARQDGIAPLAVCAGNAPSAIVLRLLEAGAEADKADADGQTALMWAAAKGRVDNLRLLIANGVDVNRTTANGFSPLFFALKSGNPEVSMLLLDAGADSTHVGPEATTAVQLAMYQQDHGFAARMIERGADVAAFDRNGYTLLHAAVIADQPALVASLLNRGANPNTVTGKPRVEWRYEANFRSGDVVTPVSSPLLLAAEKGSASMMQLLAAAGADPKFRMADGTTIVHAAASKGRNAGHVSALEVALELLPDPDVVNGEGQTALHLLLVGDPGPDTAALMRLLAAKGARTDIPDREGRTAAQTAAHPDTFTQVKAAYQAAFGTRTASL